MRDDDHSTSDCPDPNGDARSIGALIRAAADAELTDAQSAEFERLCAERDCTQDRVRFEQTLRACCERVMRASPSCSETLRIKVRALAEQSRLEEAQAAAAVPSATGATGAPGHTEASAPERMASVTRSPAFWRRSPAMVAAASVLLMVAGTLVWQASSLRTQPIAPAGWSTEQVSYRDRVSGFVTDEHLRCCRNDQASESKLIYRDLEAARSHYTQTFGVSQVSLATRPPAAGAVNFWGGGDCLVPGAKASAHLRFDAVDPDGNPLRLSLFVLPDNRLLPLSEGATYSVSSDACDEAGVSLFAWTSNGLLHLLVSEAKGDFCREIRQSFLAPARVTGLRSE
jgi:hypothetical protein